MKRFIYLLLLFNLFLLSCKEEKKAQERADQTTPLEEVNEAIEEDYVKEYIKEYAGIPTKGGELKVLLVDEPRHLNSAIQSGTATGKVAVQLFASLLSIDRDWEIHSNLAKEWEVSDDGKKITFHLHDNAYFHDMEDITVEDVAFSFEIIKNNHPFSTMLASITHVEEITLKKGIIHLKQPSPVLLTALASPMVPILPKHIYGDGQNIVGHPRNINPVGSGPFKFVSWEPYNEIILERFDNYFIPNQPYLDKVTFKYFPDKSKPLALANRSVDLIGFMVEKDIFYQTEKEELAHLYKDSEGYGGVGPLMWLAFNTKKPPFDDVRVRQAIAYAIDRELIAKTLLGSTEHIATGPLYVGTPFYTNDHNLYDVDFEKANSLLDEAGYERDENGIRFTTTINPYKQELPLTIANYIKNTLLRKVGIEIIEIKNENFKSWAENVSNHNFDLAIDIVFNWGDPVIGVHRTYSSKNIKKGVIWSNTQRYVNPKVDLILSEAEIEVDFNKRNALYFELQRILAEDLPLYPISNLPYVTIYDQKLKNMNESIWGLMFPYDKVYWKLE